MGTSVVKWVLHLKWVFGDEVGTSVMKWVFGDEVGTSFEVGIWR